MKERQYTSVLEKIEMIVPDDSDLISALSNISAIINEEFGFLWCGFYLVKGDSLSLGPFQGHPACSRIPYGKGVCGKAWQSGETIIVPDVEMFEGYIACSSIAKSEIVVPIFNGGNVFGVIDIDSEIFSKFDQIDSVYLEKIASIVSNLINNKVCNNYL